MILTTTPTVEGEAIREYLGIVSGRARVMELIGKSWRTSRNEALAEMSREALLKGADAVVGVHLDLALSEVRGGDSPSSREFTASGTAVKLR